MWKNGAKPWRSKNIVSTGVVDETECFSTETKTKIIFQHSSIDIPHRNVESWQFKTGQVSSFWFSFFQERERLPGEGTFALTRTGC